MRNLFRKSLFKKNPFKKALAATVLSAAMVTGAMANPGGPSVQNGQVNISGLGGANVNIQQLTDRAIVNWDSFSIGAREAVRFLQPSQMAIILNRVTGQDPSQILGSLSANGQVFLINPNGILFGPNSSVDVGGLVASTLGLSDDDFLAGNYNFTQDPRQELASIINQGTITISDGGYAVLTAPLVSNEGLIVANLGKVALAGGESTTLNFDGRGLISYEIGALQAEAGTVVIPREAVGGMLADMLGAEDRAGKLVERADGTLALEGGSGLTYQAGTIRTDGAAGQDAGTVAVDSARLTVLGANSVTAADGVGQNSDGGEVYALSNLDFGTTLGYSGSLLSAQGGESGGGGFLEFSGAYFSLGSSINATAQSGTIGTFLLDPRDIFVINGPSGPSPLPGPPAPLDLTINDATIETLLAGAQVTLQADRNIDLANDVVINQAGGTLHLIAGNDIFFNASTVTTGQLDIDAGNNLRFNTSTVTADTVEAVTGNYVAFDVATLDVTTGVFVSPNIDSNGASISATSLGLSSNDIRGPGNGPLQFEAENLALFLGGAGFGYYFLNDTENGLTVVPTITGIDQTINTGDSGPNFAEFSLDATDTGADTANLVLQAMPQFGTGYIRADNDLVLQTNVTASDSLLLIADFDGDGTGGISQTAGTVMAGSGLGLSAGDGGIGTAGALTGAIQVSIDSFFNSGELTLETSGSANVVETSADGVTLVDQVSTFGEILPGLSVEGITTGGSLQVAATGGATADLTVEGDIDSVGTNADLAADNDVIFGTPQQFPPAQVNVTNSLVVRADLDNDNDGTITFNGMGGPNAHLNVPNLGLALSDNFGVMGTSIDVNFGTFVVDTDPNGDGTGGTVFVRDGIGDFTLAPVTGVLQAVSQARGAGDVRFSSAGLLTVDAPVTSVTGGVLFDALFGGGTGAALSQNVTAANGQDVLIFAGGDITQTGGLVTGDNVGLLAINVGTTTNSFDLDANGLLVAATGSAYIADPDELAFASSASASGQSLIGSSQANSDLRVQAGGNITVPTTVMGTDISLISTGGGIAVNNTIGTGATANLVLSASGDITGGSTAQATNVGLDANNIGTANASFNTNATNLSIDSEGNAYIQDVDGVNLAAGVTATSFNPGLGGGVGDTVSGNSATGDLRVAANGNIDLSANLNANEISLISSGDITVPFTVTATQNAVLSATGNITGGAVIVGTGVGLRAANIGVIGGNPVNVDTQNLAVNADTDAHIEEAGNAHPSPLTLVDSVTATMFNDGTVGDSVTGNSAGDQMRIGTLGGIRINAPLNGVAADTLDLLARGGSIDQVAGTITATSLVLNSATGISQTQGQNIVGTNVGLGASSVGNIGIPGGDALDITATSLAVNAPNANGNVNVRDSAGGLFLVNSVNGVGETITGTTVGGSLELEAVGGNLAINDPVTVGGAAELVSDAQVRVNQNLNVTGNLILLADSDSSGAGSIVVADGVVINAAQLGLGGLMAEGGAADGNEIMVNTQAVTWDVGQRVRVTDLSGDLSVVGTVTGVGRTVSLDTTLDDIEVEAAAGSLQVDAEITGARNGQIELVAQNDINLNANVRHFQGGTGDSVVLLADSDNDGNGAITQVQGLHIFGDRLGLSAGGDIGVPGGNLDTNSIQVIVNSLALETTGNANVLDTNGGLTIVDSVVGDDVTVTGGAIGGSLELETSGGDGSHLTVGNNLMVGTNADLVSDHNVVFNNNVNVAGNLVVRADDDNNETGGISGAGIISASGLGLAAGESIGSLGTPFQVDVNTFAVDTDPDTDGMGGNAFVRDATGSFTVEAVTGVDETVGVARAAGDLKLDAASGDLILNIDASGANVELTSVSSVRLNGNVTATGGSAVVFADVDGSGNGMVLQSGNNRITANSVGLSAGQGIGTSNEPIEVSANQLSMETAGGSAYVSNPVSGLTIVDTVNGIANNVNGNGAQTDYRVSAVAQLVVDDTITATDISLLSVESGITVDQNVGDGGTNDLVLSAQADITGNGIARATNVGLSAGNIGSSGSSFNTSASNLAVDSRGNAYVQNGGSVNVVNQVTSTLAGDTVTGNQANGDYRLAAPQITVNDQINGQDISLITTGGNVTLNDSLVGVNNVVVNAQSLQGPSTSITQSAGTIQAMNVGLQAGFVIRGASSTDSLDVTADNLVANASIVNVRDTGGGLNLVNSVSSTAVNDTVTGNTGDSMSFFADNGALTVSGPVNTTTQLQLLAAGDVILNNAVNGNRTAIVADRDNDGNGGIIQTQGNTIASTQLGLSAGDGGIGTAGADSDAIDVQVDSLAVETSGNANILDSSGGLTVVGAVSTGGELFPTVTVTGNSTGGSLELEANGGDGASLNISSALMVGTNADLVADDDVLIGGDINVAQSLVIRADNDQNDNGGIQSNPQVPSVVSATNLGLHSAYDIGDPNGDPLDVNVTTLAVDTDSNTNQVGGGVHVRDVSGDLTIASVTGVNETVGVARSAGTLKIVAGEGDLHLNTDATSGGDTELSAGTDLNLNSNVTAGGDVLATAGQDVNIGGVVNGGVNAQAVQVNVQAGGNMVIRAGRDIVNVNGQGMLSATQLGLAAGRDAGTIASPILFNAQDLTYNTGNDVIAEDTAGGLRLVSQVTAVNDTVNGNVAGNDSRIVANNGDLQASSQSDVGNNGELVTKGSGDIIVDGDYNAGNGNVVLRSAGDIKGGGQITADGLGLDAPDGEIGSAAQPLRFDANTLTVGSRPFSTSPQTAFRRIPEVTAIIETVKDVGEPVPQPVVFFYLDGSTFAQDNVNLVEALLKEPLDNFDLIYNDEGWQYVEKDDNFGTSRR